jgi:hypothetical protein
VLPPGARVQVVFRRRAILRDNSAATVIENRPKGTGEV